MTRYQECLRRVVSYAKALEPGHWNNETLIRSYVKQPAYDVTFRENLVADTLAALTEKPS